MAIPTEESVQRFLKRTARTDEVTLYRNLEAGVYGAPGSTGRAVAERALELRFARNAEALRIATREEAEELVRRVERAAGVATKAAWVAVVAVIVALLALARVAGVS